MFYSSYHIEGLYSLWWGLRNSWIPPNLVNIFFCAVHPKMKDEIELDRVEEMLLDGGRVDIFSSHSLRIDCVVGERPEGYKIFCSNAFQLHITGKYQKFMVIILSDIFERI